MKNNILSNLQFGFRKKSNTTLAISNLLNDFTVTFNRKFYNIALFIDLKKSLQCY